MGEITLSGQEFEINVESVTMIEWRNFFSGKSTHEEEDAFVSKITGKSIEDIQNMLRNDYRRLLVAIIKAGSEPLADPN